MIAKHVPMHSLGKSDFARLVNYVTDVQGKNHRVGEVRVTNCDAGSLRDAITEVLATQWQNTRACGDKTYHLIVSFRPGEQISADTLKIIEDRICAGLGYGEHQRISAVHSDTDNLHFHIAINKIHPTRLTMREPYYPHRTLAKICKTLERDYGLECDNHEPRRRGAENRAVDMEKHSGVQSLLGWIRNECLDEIRGAQSWQALHQIMRTNGLELRVRANGIVFEANDGTMVKASTVARELSKPSLEARIGPFEASSKKRPTQKTRQYLKAPIRLRVDTTNLYARYKAEQQTMTGTRGQALVLARWRKDQAVEAAKRSSCLRRSMIKLVAEGSIVKKILYAQASKALRDELQAISAQYKKERQALYEANRHRTWADWLKSEAIHGNAEALTALRARDAAQGLMGNTIRGEGQAKPGYIPAIDNITKKGTIIYRAGASAIRDDGDKLQVSRETSSEDLQEALRLAMQRYGDRITVTGTVEFRARMIRAAVDARLPITFVDPVLEIRRQALSNKETNHERHELEHRGRAGRGVSETGQLTATHGNTRPDVRSSQSFDVRRADIHQKPDLGSIGRVPPPESQHSLRTLSQLGVVRIAGGSEMLLPRDVPHDVEQRRTQPAHSLRRTTAWLGVAPATTAAADRYIAERNAKKQKIFDIPKHSRYTPGKGALSFQGVRYIDGEGMALLRRGDADVTMVMPIDQATARRLSRVKVGDAVSITAKGSIKTSRGRNQ